MPASDRDEGADGHHVLHVRVPNSYQKRCLARQREQAEEHVKSFEAEKLQDRWTLTSKLDPSLVAKRAEIVKESISNVDKATTDDWLLFNGFVVGSTVIEDARAFHVPFKEPCLVVFRSVDAPPKNEGIKDPTISSAVMMGSPDRNLLGRGDSDAFPGRGDMVAFDAEFVSTQEENSYVNDSGQKVSLRETRHALARISLLDCRANEGWPPSPPNILVDDYVLPREPVVDYLTRFSGIVANDLDPKKSPHNLISPRLAYLKLRFLLERGVIFVGHGLSQDFVTANLSVPPSQVIDTVTLYHKPGQRFISLRFLANYVLQRDMQEEVHDSVEDARAAWELYQHVRRKKEEGIFDQFLNELYDYGEKRDWKLRVDLRRDSRKPDGEV
uniref:Exonuclease domain-containing protein n=2 Tax=Grammatophora oceanica TaxID=210454 RepID=A0A7S1Y9Q7_9STRA|mmetsp:Transcript_34339/g.50959  ORF Transcript_34339/g.50959 Transcript_34339/m.50959 type:complete len:385 (+) Transcript_34339:215-1369(+)